MTSAKVLFFVLSRLLAAASGVVATVTSAPIVNLGYSQYQGSWNATSNVTSFLGIRYATPPTGAFDITLYSLGGSWNPNLDIQGP
jgi:hypothetical protein